MPRLRLPSRNWMIFWTLSGSLASAIYYDKWQTKKVKEKWCRLVSPMADEPLDVKTLPRTVTIYLSAPPGDGLRSAREHFHNYIKPILVAAAVNWDVIEGRKEGDVRYKTAQLVRDRRKAAGEESVSSDEDVIAKVRQGMGVEEYAGVAGDLVVGRHTWKEYMRGLHEGWLGPIDPPPGQEESIATPAALEPAAATPSSEPASEVSSTDLLLGSSIESDSKESPAEESAKAEDASPEPAKKEEEVEEKPKPRFPPPYLAPEAYGSATLPRTIPEVLDPAAPISCPHILGFRNTPIRFYRYLTRRRTADEIGRQVASAILGQSRPFNTTAQDNDGSPSSEGGSSPEQTLVLQREEKDWWKTVRAPRQEHEESVLIEPFYLNEQITSRMRIFELTADDEARSKRADLTETK